MKGEISGIGETWAKLLKVFGITKYGEAISDDTQFQASYDIAYKKLSERTADKHQNFNLPDWSTRCMLFTHYVPVSLFNQVNEITASITANTSVIEIIKQSPLTCNELDYVKNIEPGFFNVIHKHLLAQDDDHTINFANIFTHKWEYPASVIEQLKMLDPKPIVLDDGYQLSFSLSDFSTALKLKFTNKSPNATMVYYCPTDTQDVAELVSVQDLAKEYGNDVITKTHTRHVGTMRRESNDPAEIYEKRATMGFLYYQGLVGSILKPQNFETGEPGVIALVGGIPLGQFNAVQNVINDEKKKMAEMMKAKAQAQ